jgi:putative Holliday junction resolvase
MSQMIASPFKTLIFKSDAGLISDLLAIIEREQVERVIIGLPLNENGTQSPGCARVKRFAAKLKTKGIATVLWDERFSSLEAQDVLSETGIRGRKAEERIDQIAASIILRDYLSAADGSL